MADAFFAKASSTFEGYNITDDQIRTLEECVKGVIPPAEAARKLTLRVEASPAPIEMQQRLAGLWELLNTTAVRLPDAQPCVISILQAMRGFPKVEIPDGEFKDELQLHDGDIWRELTNWAINWSDDWNHYAVRVYIQASKSREERKVREADWISANAFQARLCATGDEELSSLGRGLERASDTIAMALEVKGVDVPLDVTLVAAAQLFIYASAELLSLCQEGHLEGLDPPDINDPGTESLWLGKRGFSEERWSFWKGRWSVWADDEDISPDARKTASEALEAMKKAEH